MKHLFLLLNLSLLPATLWAQALHRPTNTQKVKALVLPVDPATGLITYHDTVRAPGASVKDLLNRVYDSYAKNFTYADYVRGDTTKLPKPSTPAATGEVTLPGSVAMYKPGEEAVYMPGVSPPSVLDNYPPYQLLHFTIRLRTEPGVCYLTLTDLRQRPAILKQEMARSMGAYYALAAAAATRPVPPVAAIPATTAAEKLYAPWLPGYRAAPIPAASPGGRKKPNQPPVAQAQQFDTYARLVLGTIRGMSTR